MSSRALRKAQREREERERLRQSADQGEAEVEVESEEDTPTPAKKSMFALLEGGDADDGGEEPEDDDEEGGVGVDQAPAAAPTSTPTVSGNKKKKKGKKKKKKKAADASAGSTPRPQTDEQLDEIDDALKQLATNGHAPPAAGTASAGVEASVAEASRLLAVDPNHLHAQNEMRRLFGRSAVEWQDEDEAPQNRNVGGNRRQQRQIHQMGLAHALRRQGNATGRDAGLASIALRRNLFIQGKEEWPVATGGGLGMEVEEKRAEGTVLYRFVHTRSYQDVQAQFNIAVESMDPNRLVLLLQHHPYHISTLLQVSEIAKQDRDHSTSGDLLERALFSFGRAVHSTFAKSTADGNARLDFARPENREFWLASWRYMQNLSMRATWRTVYEWAKLLLSLSPQEDPYAMWLVLDQYALRSRQDLDFLNLSRNAKLTEGRGNMPGLELSQGLAEWRAGNKSNGQQALFTAIGRYPWLVAQLMQELALDPPPAIWGKEPRTEREKLYSELYASRAKDLWNTPESSALLVEIASAVPPDTPTAEPDREEITANEARHVLLSDTPSLIALIPRKYTAQLLSSSDPLPPENNNPSYTLTHSPSRPTNTGAEGSREDTLRELHGLYGFFSNLFPWLRPSGAEGEVAEEQPSEEAFLERIRESGVDEQLLVQRRQRFLELQERLEHEANFDPQMERNMLVAIEGGDRGAMSATEASAPERVAAEDPEGQRARQAAREDGGGEGVGRRVTIEDADDLGD